MPILSGSCEQVHSRSDPYMVMHASCIIHAGLCYNGPSHQLFQLHVSDSLYSQPLSLLTGP